jgi:atypical dual specificity phosphatase
MDEVFPGLYVGTLTDAGDESVLQNYGIEKIVSLTYGDPESGFPDSVPVITVAMMDGPRNSKAPFQKAVDEVLSAMRDGKNVLVHCSKGASRSPAVAATAVAIVDGVEISKAFEQIAQQRSAVDPHDALVVHARDIAAKYDT